VKNRTAVKCSRNRGWVWGRSRRVPAGREPEPGLTRFVTPSQKKLSGDWKTLSTRTPSVSVRRARPRPTTGCIGLLYKFQELLRVFFDILWFYSTFKKVLPFLRDAVIRVRPLTFIDFNQLVVHKFTQPFTCVSPTESCVSRDIARRQFQSLWRAQKLEYRLICGFHPGHPPIHTVRTGRMRGKLCSVTNRLLRLRFL